MGLKFWIQKAIKKPGTLHRQLGIPKGEKIPFSLLREIVDAKAGETIVNPSKVGKKKYKVTGLMEKKAILALNLKRISEK